MIALFRSGRQAEALACCRRLHDRLAEEIGVDPSPSLQELHDQVLRHDAALVPPRSRQRSTGGTARRGDVRLADRTTSSSGFSPDLIGRTDDVAEIARLITASPLVTLIGPGGLGKTRLAEQVHVSVDDVFADGVAFCGLAGVRDPDGVGGALITALGIQPTGERTVADTLVAALGDRHLLLLLDNCAHVIDAVVPLVDAVLAGCPHVAVLATSRERLHLPGEQVRTVPPLAVPASGAGADAVAATPAGALFGRARRPWNHPSPWTTTTPPRWPSCAAASMACRWQPSWPWPASARCHPQISSRASISASRCWPADRRGGRVGTGRCRQSSRGPTTCSPPRRRRCSIGCPTETLGPEVRGADEQTAVRALDAAIDDLRAAHGWMIATDDVDGALRLPARAGGLPVLQAA